MSSRIIEYLWEWEGDRCNDDVALVELQMITFSLAVTKFDKDGDKIGKAWLNNPK